MIYTATYTINRKRDRFRTYPIYAPDGAQATIKAIKLGGLKDYRFIGLRRGWDKDAQ